VERRVFLGYRRVRQHRLERDPGGLEQAGSCLQGGASDGEEDGRFDDLPTVYSPLSIASGTPAFLGTLDLWTYAPEYTPPEPNYLYFITVLSAHHNVLQVAFQNLSLVQTEEVVTTFLKDNSSF
jgi:hypothetical protein